MKALSTAHRDPQSGRELPTPATLLQGEAELSCLPACQVLFPYVFLSVDLVGNGGAEGAWGQEEKDVKGGEEPGVRSGDEREALHYPVSLT